MSTPSYQQILEQDLFPALREGGLVVTATGRLARRIRFRYGQWRRAANATVWRRPAVMSWQEWVRQLWEDSLLRGGKAGDFTLLSSHGSLMLWEQAVGKNAVAGFDLEQNAELARRSWNLALEYGLNLERLRSEVDGEDERRFARWVARFEELRRSGSWLEPAGLPPLLTQDLQSGAIAARGPLHLLGFNDPLPTPQSELLETVRSAGISVETGPAAPRAANVCQIQYENGDEELQAAASWAVEGNAGLVLVDFTDRAPRARRALLDRMQPAWQTRGFPQDAPLNSAEAPSLGHAGPAEMALDALCLLPTVVDFEVVSRVLRGAYLHGSDAEASGRARVERRIRERLVGGEITRAQLMARTLSGAPLLAQALQKAWKASRKARGKGRAHSYRTWAGVFTTFLRELGWPGDRPLVSSEQQAMEAFGRLLSEYGGCDAISARPVPLAAALSRLGTMARDRKFQPQGPDQAVELLPVEESAGLHFDRLWVAGAGANLWPRGIRPAPLLPLGLQRRMKMPQASAQSALDQARRQTQALLHSADEVVFSWSKVAEEGVETSCSPLIAQVPLRDPSSVEEAVAGPAYVEVVRAGASLETLRDDAAPPLLPDEEVGGGTRLMDHQLRNPFRAFAEHRLHAAEYPRPWDGISPLDRGDIVHKLLCRLYTEFGDAASLAEALPDLKPSLQEWAAQIPRKEPPGVRPLVLGLLRMERERAVLLALDWVRLDLERGEFSVRKLEELAQLDLGPVTLRMRLDRVDQPGADAGALVLDYKTGREIPLSGLNPERLRSSQLPAYALVTPDVSGVGYVFLSGRQRAVKGICDPSADIPGKEKLPKLTPISKHRDFRHYANWESVLAAWREALEKAAMDLSRGDARVEIFSWDDGGRGQYQVLSRIQELEQA
ncbi:MAG: hypothetical protein F4013_06175 [Gammaproteobacteria bacterium]|nr:hypothetical protein [Gammaproteobacteria bacterium]